MSKRAICDGLCGGCNTKDKPTEIEGMREVCKGCLMDAINNNKFKAFVSDDKEDDGTKVVLHFNDDIDEDILKEELTNIKEIL